MAYCTPSDILNRYKKFGSGKTTDTDIQIQITNVEAYLNSRLSVKYTVPFATVPAEIKRLAIDFTVLSLLDFSYIGMPSDVIDGLLNMKKKLEAELDAIIKGNANLVDSSGNIISTIAGMGYPVSTTDTYNPTFNLLDEQNQIVDTDRLTAELDALK